MLYIAFIGNCQMATLCFYLQELLKDKNDYIIKYLQFESDFKIGEYDGWLEKVNKVLNINERIEYIKICDYIFYQEIVTEKSIFSNEKYLLNIKKNNCKLTKLPSMYFDFYNYENSLFELTKRENQNKVDIKVSKIINKYKMYNIMLTKEHPKTFLFLQVMKEICCKMNISFFKSDVYYKFMKNDNYMNLP